MTSVCPRRGASCPASFADVARLAGHLVTDHLVSATTALNEAKDSWAAPKPLTAAVTPPEPAKEPTMGKQKKCGKCGKPGHQAKTCGRQDAKPIAKTTRASPAASVNGHGSVAAHIRGLVQAVAAGKSAETELAAIRALLAK